LEFTTQFDVLHKLLKKGVLLAVKPMEGFAAELASIPGWVKSHKDV